MSITSGKAPGSSGGSEPGQAVYQPPDLGEHPLTEQSVNQSEAVSAFCVHCGEAVEPCDCARLLGGCTFPFEGYVHAGSRSHLCQVTRESAIFGNHAEKGQDDD